jgi:hypothetical protein
VDGARYGRLFVGPGSNVGHIICAPLRKPFCMKQEFTRWSIARQGGVQSFDVSAWTIEASLIRATDAVTDRK